MLVQRLCWQTNNKRFFALLHETSGHLRTLLATLRIPFLPLTLVCVSLGWASAWWSGASISAATLGLVTLGALSAHISVNAFNEYFDFESGIDLHTVRTPFNGGSGALPAQPEAARLVLLAALLASAITIVIGIALVQRVGFGLMPLGVAGLALVYTYTQWLNRNPFLSLVAAGTGFGIMVLGTYYVLTHRYDAAAIIAFGIIFFLVNNLLLLNQFPDVEADRRAGRRNLPIVIGRRRSASVLGAFFAAAYGCLAIAVTVGYLPVWSLLGLVTAPLALQIFAGARYCADDLSVLRRYLGKNVLVVLLTPFLIALGLVFAALSGAT